MKFWSSIFIFVITLSVVAQNDYPFGQFKTRIIDHNENESGVQNWDIIQNENHLIYVANNSGILEFNGEHWSIFKMSNQEHPRSFAKNDRGEIFVGGQGEFAIIKYDDKGKAYSQKISSDVDSIDFKDIWEVHCIEEKTYFIARSHIFIQDSGKTEVIKSPEGQMIMKSFKTGKSIFCAVKDKNKVHGTYLLRGNKFFKVQNKSNRKIIGDINIKSETYLVDESGRYYKLISRKNNFKLEPIDKKLDFKGNYKIKSISNNEKIIVVGTTGNGAKIYDLEGNYLRSAGNKEGLTNSITHSSMFDQYGNLWLCNDNGLAFIEMSSPVTAFYEEHGVTGGITENLLIKNDDIYLATHSDIYKNTFENGQLHFEQKPTFNMETWQIKSFQFSDGTEHTLVIANDGVYELSGNFERKTIQRPLYAWDLEQSTSNPNRIYIGLDGGGVASILYENGTYEYEGHYSNTSGDVRSILEYKDNIYYTVKHDGLILLDTNNEQSQNIVPGLNNNADSSKNFVQFTLEEYNNTVYVGTSHGLYEMHENKLIESPVINNYFVEDSLLIHRIINDGSGKLWIVMFHKSGSENERAEIGYLTTKGDQFSWTSSKFNIIKDDVIFCLEKGSNGVYWLGGVKGLYVYNEQLETNFDQSFQVDISGVFIDGEQQWLYHTKHLNDIDPVLDYEQNTIRFEFGSNAYLGGLTNEYSYYLEGEENNWSKWKLNAQAEYQRLAEGDYVFHLKAKNFYGYESEETTFSFTILPPWYRTWWAYLIYFLGFILLVYIIIRLSIRRVKAQNERLEEIVEERTAEIAEQNNQLEIQKAEIVEKTNDIVDSIKYAKRIQTAILPTDDGLKEVFESEHFVFYRPKDIVSGDFYWADKFDSEAIFAAVDCTGHGVPGAFVSIVGFNGLNRTVNEFKLRDPGKILDKLTDLVVGTFEKSESQIKDGMDIALCNLDYKSMTLKYAGANNPLILVRNKEIVEIKANKQPIGEFERREPFETHEVKLQKGDCIYVFSDGYADQFGGTKGKKFKGKNLKKLLIDVSEYDMKTQHQKLQEAFEEWKGDFEQLDDVCLFGVKV